MTILFSLFLSYRMLKEAGNVLFEQHRLIADDGDVFRKVKNRVKK